MTKKMTELLATDKKLRALFSGMISSGFAFISLMVITGIAYL